MQVLMAASAQDRVGEGLVELAPELDVVTVTCEGVFQRGGVDVDAAGIDPEVFWVSEDARSNGLMTPMYRKLLSGGRGRWVQVFNAGLDNPTFKRVMAKGLRLTKSNAQAAAIAEYVVAHALSLLHPIAEEAAAQAERAWRRIEFREIGHSEWLIVGFGSIGREIARRVRPFGAGITVVRRAAGEDMAVDRVAAQADLPELLPLADVVVLACALTDATRGMADQAFFRALRPGAILINIGRGELVDEDALRRALDADVVRAAVLDVFQTEPLPGDAWQWRHPKVRVTAHTSNAGAGVTARGDAQFLDNLRRFRAGAELIGEAHPSEVGL